MQHGVLICLVLLLAGCGNRPEPAGSGKKTEPPPSVIGEPLQQSLSKARSVEDLTAKRKGGVDQAVDEAN